MFFYWPGQNIPAIDAVKKHSAGAPHQASAMHIKKLMVNPIVKQEKVLLENRSIF